MIIYKFQLEPYKGQKSRFICPKCGSKKTFTKYVNVESGDYVGDSVGRCSREVKCEFHYTPKQFFEDNKFANTDFASKPIQRPAVPLNNNSHQISSIPIERFKQSLKAYSNNNFIKYLLTLFGSKLTEEAIRVYLIGTSKYWNNATVFWQIDSFGKIRTGKIMLYNPDTGKRIKNPQNYISWAHTALKLKNFKLQQCFFGEHLIKNDIKKKIAIVESEKTAIISSIYFPQFIWLATGSISNLSIEKFKILTDRKIIMFPDLKGFEKWHSKAKEIMKKVKCEIVISEILEKNSSSLEKEKGLDIADYLIKQDATTGWALSTNNYPLFWDI